MKNIVKNILLLTVLVLAVGACDTFDVSNDNPDVALSIENNPELLLTNIQRNAINNMVGSAWSEGNLMAQYGARIVFTEFDLFNWGDQSGTWNSFYLSLRDARELRSIAQIKSHNSYEAVSLIMQAWIGQILTDMWGDVPFSQAAAATADEPIYTPAYDSQEEIYTQLLDYLDQANSLLGASYLPNIKGDIVFNGDLAKWRKFANSLRLRVAMRLSKVQPATAQAEISKIVANATQYPVMTSNDDNAVLKYLAARPNAHPITEESTYRSGSYNEYRISETVEGVLRSFNDPRLEFWADPTANSVAAGTPEISGMKNGIVDGPAYIYKGGDAFLSKFNSDYFFFSSNSNEARLMQYSEVAFIMAEAAFRGWISADAGQWYNEGVSAAITYWGIELPAGYLTAPESAYNNTLDRIMQQKYLALFYTDFQGFIEYRRTGFPSTIQPGPDAFYSTYPSRFEYPSKEEALNASNRQAAISRQGPDEITTKVWWEK